MMSNWRLAGASLTVLALVLGAGCSPSNVLSPSNGNVSLQSVADPAVGPRDASKPPFVWAKATLAAVTLTPVDTGSQISLGPTPLQVLEQASDVDLALSDAQSINTISISPGSYAVTALYLSKIQLNTSNEPPVTSPSPIPRCADGALEYAQFAPVGGGTPAIVPANLPTLEVRSGAKTTLRLVVDGSGLTTLLESHVTCEEGGTGATVTAIPLQDLAAVFSFQAQ
jgi:hypothetical protein